MTRPIKFRAWDIDSSTMNYMKNRNTDFCLEFNDNGEMELWCPYHDDDGNYDTEKRNSEIMQFTGLLDKNGKEIYEGDIVKTYDDEGNIENNGYASLVLFKNCCFHLYDDYEVLRDKSAGWGSAEVIGNRFENPELLK